jgi:hypothetical protein
MALDTGKIKQLFNATINTVAINSATGSERSVINQITRKIAIPLGLNLYIWDCGEKLTQANFKIQDKKFLGIERVPATNYKSKGHPVEDLLNHIRSESHPSSSSSPTLFIIKDLYQFFNTPSPNPVLTRLAIETWFDVKISLNKIIILHDNLGTPGVFQDLVADITNPLPNEKECREILNQQLEGLKRTAAAQNADFKVEISEKDRDRIVRALLGMTTEAVQDVVQLCGIEQREINSKTADIITRIKKEKLATRGIEFAEEPDVEVQGMPLLQQWVSNVTPLLEPEAQKDWNLPFPRGMIIVGVGGTGKSLAVKCLARTWGLPTIVLDFGMLMGSKLGESEQKLKESLRLAESMSPCILWADEFDKAMAGNSSGESDGGTSARMLGYFLRWLIESKAQVFVAATANRIDGFKPELLRRFKVVYVDLPNKEARKSIWEVQLTQQKITLPEADIKMLASESAGYTGDEIGKTVKECAGVAYGQRRPGQVTAAELLTQLRSKPPQFEGNQELEEQRKWVRAGGATFAAPDIATETTHISSWHGERNVNFSDFTEFGETEIN